MKGKYITITEEQSKYIKATGKTDEKKENILKNKI